MSQTQTQVVTSHSGRSRPSLAPRRSMFPVVDDQSDTESSLTLPNRGFTVGRALPDDDRRPLYEWRIVDDMSEAGSRSASRLDMHSASSTPPAHNAAFTDEDLELATSALSLSFFRLPPPDANMSDPRFFGRPPGHQDLFSPTAVRGLSPPSPAPSNYSLAELVGPGHSWSQASTPAPQEEDEPSLFDPDLSDSTGDTTVPGTPVRHSRQVSAVFVTSNDTPHAVRSSAVKVASR